MTPDPNLICICGRNVPEDKNGCSCGRSREFIEDQHSALNREANLTMMGDLPPYLADEPWGAR